MSETQEVLDPTRPCRRAIGVFLLGMIPLAVAGTAGIAAGAVLPAAEPESSALGVELDEEAAPSPGPDVTAGIVASGTTRNVDYAAAVESIKVTVPKPVVKQAAQPTATKAATSKSTTATKDSAKKSTSKKSDKKSSSKKSTSKKSSSKKSTSKKSASQSFKSYCSSPKSPYGASGGAKALMSAANKERARLGIAPLTWSGSLASASKSWSQAMAKKDSGTKATMDALSHNPNRPGAENVAVSYSSGGVSEGAATNRAHSGWIYSNGHCLNLMNPAYSQMGAGSAVTADGTTWYTTANYR